MSARLTSPAQAKADSIDRAGKNYPVVDDFIGVRQLLREALRSLGAKNIDQAASGGEAIGLLARTRYDVVLCEFNLGDGKNGQQVLEEARVRNLLLPSSVWMMVSAEKSVESVMGAAEHQPDAYLVKPITEGVLLTRLNRAWHRKQVFRPIDQACAEKDYLRAARLCDEQIAASRVHEVELLRMKARLMEKSGEPEKAREACERVLAQREYQWARAGLAKIRLADGEFEAARQMFQGVIAENRYYIDAYDQLALAYQGMGKLEESCSILERAARLSPNSVPRQRNLGLLCLKLGNVALAEKAFRKCIAVGAYSVRRTPDAYLGLARVCGLKNEPKEAQALLQAAQRMFGELSGDTHPDIDLRSKITEGLVYHESGDYRRARKAGDELDNAVLLDEVQAIFDKARLTDEGGDLIRASKKEAADLMNQGVLLWKTGKLQEAVEWMRAARARLPNNLRILFNAAQVLVSHMRERGFDEALSLEAYEVLAQVDRLQPGQQRFAQLIEQLAALAPTVEAESAPAVDTTA